MKMQIEAIESRRLLSAVTGSVFVDTNGDGAFTSGVDKRLAGATGYIDLNNDAALQAGEPQATSDINGYLKIDDARIAAGGAYAFRTSLPAGYVQTTLPLAKTIQVKSATSSTYVGLIATKQDTTPTGPTPPTDPGPPTSTTGGLMISAWSDTNNNGRIDTGEPYLPNQKYFIDKNLDYTYDAGDQLIGPGYAYLNVNPGRYRLLAIVDPPDRLSNPSLTTYVDLFVTAGQITRFNFGIYHPARYTGHAYEDLNKNGKFDRGEGLFDRNIVAYSTTGGRTYADMSYVDGTFSLDLDPGTYRVTQILPGGWTGSGDRYITVKGSTTTVVSGVDFTSRPVPSSTKGVITGKVFDDANGNGKQDSGEGAFFTEDSSPPRVWIDYNKDGYEGNEDTRASATHGGTFTFVNVKPGKYRIAIANWDSYSRVTTVRYRDVTVAANKTVTAGSFGLQLTYVVHVAAYTDVDNDGVFDPPMSGSDPSDTWGDKYAGERTIYVDANNNGKLDPNEQSLVTDRYGVAVEFVLPRGTYTLREKTPAGYKQTGRAGLYLTGLATFKADSKLRLPDDIGADAPDGEVTLIFLSNVDYNAADPKTGKVSGFAYFDTDGDGAFEYPEPADANQRIFLDRDGDGVLDPDEPSDTTDAFGNFDLTGVAAGSYTLRGQYAAGFTTTDPTFLTFARGQSLEYQIIGRRKV